MKEITGKLDFTKIKNFCSVKDSVKRMRRQATDCEKIFVNTYLIKDSYPNNKELSRLNNKKMNTLI